jgi:hypothetical protein
LGIANSPRIGDGHFSQTETVLTATTKPSNAGHRLTNRWLKLTGNTSCGYDPIGHLQTATGSGGQSTESFGYLNDHARNLATLTNAGVSSTFAVNSDNKLTSALGNSCAYDGNGILTASRSTVGYTYDVENRLSVITNGQTYYTKFVYDGLGRLRQETEDYWLGGGWTVSGNTTNYIYDGNLVIEERNDLAPYVNHTRGNDLSGSLQGYGGIGGMLARTTGYNSTSGTWRTQDYYHERDGFADPSCGTPGCAAAREMTHRPGGITGNDPDKIPAA